MRQPTLKLYSVAKKVTGLRHTCDLGTMPCVTDSLEDYFVDLFKGIYEVEERDGQRHMRRILKPAHSLLALQDWFEGHLGVMIGDGEDLIRAIINSTDLQRIKSSLQEWADSL